MRPHLIALRLPAEAPRCRAPRRAGTDDQDALRRRRRGRGMRPDDPARGSSCLMAARPRVGPRQRPGHLFGGRGGPRGAGCGARDLPGPLLAGRGACVVPNELGPRTNWVPALCGRVLARGARGAGARGRARGAPLPPHPPLRGALRGGALVPPQAACAVPKAARCLPAARAQMARPPPAGAHRPWGPRGRRHATPARPRPWAWAKPCMPAARPPHRPAHARARRAVGGGGSKGGWGEREGRRGGWGPPPGGHERKKNVGPFLDLCVSSLRRGHANLLCIVPILTDVPEGTPGRVASQSSTPPQQRRAAPAAPPCHRRPLEGVVAPVGSQPCTKRAIATATPRRACGPPIGPGRAPRPGRAASRPGPAAAPGARRGDGIETVYRAIWNLRGRGV
jgi:hypothetical protein